MITLAEIPFKDLQAGMLFIHREHGEQIILDLGRNNFGPIIQFHNSDIFSGKLPVSTDEEIDIFEALAKTTYPNGAESWEYLGMLTPEQIAAHGWQFFEAACPHCNTVHRLLAAKPPSGQRQCLVCGMVHTRSFVSSAE